MIELWVWFFEGRRVCDIIRVVDLKGIDLVGGWFSRSCNKMVVVELSGRVVVYFGWLV